MVNKMGKLVRVHHYEPLVKGASPPSHKYSIIIDYSCES